MYHFKPRLGKTKFISYQVSTSATRPKGIIVLFTKYNERITENTLKFEHGYLQNITLYLNTEHYLQEDLMLDTNLNDCSKALNNY